VVLIGRFSLAIVGCWPDDGAEGCWRTRRVVAECDPVPGPIGARRQRWSHVRGASGAPGVRGGPSAQRLPDPTRRARSAGRTTTEMRREHGVGTERVSVLPSLWVDLGTASEWVFGCSCRLGEGSRRSRAESCVDRAARHALPGVTSVDRTPGRTLPAYTLTAAHPGPQGVRYPSPTTSNRRPIVATWYHRPGGHRRGARRQNDVCTGPKVGEQVRSSSTSGPERGD
jgi:hypothetical protein